MKKTESDKAKECKHEELHSTMFTVNKTTISRCMKCGEDVIVDRRTGHPVITKANQCNTK